MLIRRALPTDNDEPNGRFYERLNRVQRLGSLGNVSMEGLRTERELAGVAVALGAHRVGDLSPAESALAAASIKSIPTILERIRKGIEDGADPLGEAFCSLRTPLERRPMGATYTPSAIVAAMTEWAGQRTPTRVVDPGSGTGRFVIAAGRRFPRARLIATEIDPLAGLLLRANLACSGLAARATVSIGDYRSLVLPKVEGPTLFLGNPPYVRHHLIEAPWKAWLVSEAAKLGLLASQLSGLHVHFFVATAAGARPGDYGVFITAAEWLDVNYGSLVRQLFLGKLGGRSLHFLEPTVRSFADADTTAVIACFEIGTRAPSVRLRRVASVDALGGLNTGRPVRRERLESAQRWTPLTQASKKVPAGFVELGELCRVHRGQVTGANHVWIAGEHGSALPDEVLFPSVTKARELFAAGPALAQAANLRRVIDLPAELDQLRSEHRKSIDDFLRVARRMGADRGFVASHRKAWWSVGLRVAAPILATYMARRPPAFVRNLAGARHINIAHGLYPRDPLSPQVLDALARYLSTAITLAQGRTYAGGLTKFEPKEMERMLVPTPDVLLTPQFI